MANGFLQLATKDYPGEKNYERGDIMSAVPYLQVRWDEAGRHLLKRDQRTRLHARINAQGFFDVTDCCFDCDSYCQQFMFERLSRLEMRKCLLDADGNVVDEVRFESNKKFIDPFGNSTRPVAMDVEAFFTRAITTLRKGSAERPSTQGKFLYGTDENKLIYFGGRTTRDKPEMDKTWTSIANKLQEPEPADMVAAFSDMRKTFVLAVDDFDYQEGSDLTSSLHTDPDQDGNTEMLKKRSRLVNYRSLFTGRDLADIEDKRTLVDRRREPARQRRDVVTVKSRSR